MGWPGGSDQGRARVGIGQGGTEGHCYSLANLGQSSLGRGEVGGPLAPSSCMPTRTSYIPHGDFPNGCVMAKAPKGPSVWRISIRKVYTVDLTCLSSTPGAGLEWVRSESGAGPERMDPERDQSGAGAGPEGVRRGFGAGLEQLWSVFRVG